jgi:hypothetical protein
MPERRRDGHQEQPEQVRRRTAEPPVDVRVARVLALQRSAGNHAVVSALRARTLQRLTAGDVKKLKGEEKTKYENTKAKYEQHFAIGAPLYEYPNLELDGWSWYFGEAGTVAALEATVNKLVERATEWKKLRDQAAAQPSTATSKQQTTQPKQQTTQPKQPSQRKQKGTDITADVVGSKSYSPAPQTTTQKPPTVTVPNLPPKLNYIQRSLNNWNGTDHTGKEGDTLTLEEVQRVVAYVQAKWAARPFKGRGSGKWAGTWQLKISELGQVGGKSATWHLTLSQAVYTALAVPEAGS